jgi:hypothetical protein
MATTQRERSQLPADEINATLPQFSGVEHIRQQESGKDIG